MSTPPNVNTISQSHLYRLHNENTSEMWKPTNVKTGAISCSHLRGFTVCCICSINYHQRIVCSDYYHASWAEWWWLTTPILSPIAIPLHPPPFTSPKPALSQLGLALRPKLIPQDTLFTSGVLVGDSFCEKRILYFVHQWQLAPV